MGMCIDFMAMYVKYISTYKFKCMMDDGTKTVVHKITLEHMNVGCFSLGCPYI